MSQYMCSVVVVQYNPVWEKLKRTLNSVINQKNCNYEIIIADDGSKVTCFDEIRGFFEENKVQNYQIIHNEVNGGTVKNVISGIKAATGKYVRVIAPGDMLYSDTTLGKIVDFMEEHRAKQMFGKMAFFEQCDGKINIIQKQVPCDYRPYQRKDVNSIKRHLLILGDNISGASYTWEREYYLECLTRIFDRVVYLEDCASAYTIYDGYDICFMDEFVVWYEYGTGISTSKNNKWTTILIQDWIAFYKELEKRYPREFRIKRAKLYYQMCQRGIIIDKVIKNILFLNRYIYSRFVSNSLSNTKYEQIEEEHILKYF